MSISDKHFSDRTSPQDADTRESPSPGDSPAPAGSLEQLHVLSPKVLAASAEFVSAVRKLLSPRKVNTTPMRAENLADKFFSIKRELRESKDESTVYSDRRIVGMFYSPEFFPKSWHKLEQDERIKVITENVKLLEPDMRECLASHRGKRRGKEKVQTFPHSELPTAPASTPTSETAPGIREHQQSAEISQSGLADPQTIETRTALPDTIIQPFRNDLLATELYSLPVPIEISHWPYRLSKPLSLINLLNESPHQLRSWLQRNGTAPRLFERQISQVHPGMRLLFADLQELGLSRNIVVRLEKFEVFQMNLENSQLVPDLLAPMRVIDNGFRLLTSQAKHLKVIPAEQLNQIREKFRALGFSGNQGE